jgi:Na+/H+ antiporter NhaA
MIEITLTQSLLLITTLFLLGYWIGIFLLTYHLIRFGIGREPRIMAFIMIIGSVILTIISIMLALTIK